MHSRRVAFHWSGGKDSALALSRLLADDDMVVDRLVTTIHPDRGASTVHGLPVDLLLAQAAGIGVDLETIPLPGAGLDGYVEAMDEAAARLGAQGIDAFAFGDLSSSGVLQDKIDQFGPHGIDVIEPLWGMTSAETIEAFLVSGIRAVSVVVDAKVLDESDAGVEIDRAFVEALPAGSDPCGEYGEYHSFAYDGPIFRSPIPFTLSATHRLDCEVGTTDGLRSYSYWLATPRSPADAADPKPPSGGSPAPK